MDVRFVHAARVHEARRGRDPEVDECGESFAVRKIALAAETLAAARVGVGGWVEVVFEPGVGWALGLKDCKAVDAVDG